MSCVLEAPRCVYVGLGVDECLWAAIELIIINYAYGISLDLQIVI